MCRSVWRETKWDRRLNIVKFEAKCINLPVSVWSCLLPVFISDWDSNSCLSTWLQPELTKMQVAGCTCDFVVVVARFFNELNHLKYEDLVLIQACWGKKTLLEFGLYFSCQSIQRTWETEACSLGLLALAGNVGKPILKHVKPIFDLIDFIFVA